MTTFKDRLIDEKNQLDEKISKLEAFFMNPAFKEIEPIQMSLLNTQVQIMHAYSQILTERLAWIK